MLPKTIYESLPYMYIGGGASEVVYLDSFLANFSGVLLYLAGAMVWVLRSNHRRRDSEETRKKATLPETFYEFFPFISIGAGIALYSATDSWMFYPSAILFVAAGLQALALRSIHRHRNDVAAVQG